MGGGKGWAPAAGNHHHQQQQQPCNRSMAKGASMQCSSCTSSKAGSSGPFAQCSTAPVNFNCMFIASGATYRAHTPLPLHPPLLQFSLRLLCCPAGECLCAGRRVPAAGGAAAPHQLPRPVQARGPLPVPAPLHRGPPAGRQGGWGAQGLGWEQDKATFACCA